MIYACAARINSTFKWLLADSSNALAMVVAGNGNGNVRCLCVALATSVGADNAINLNFN